MTAMAFAAVITILATVVDARAAEQQATIIPDRILKGTTPTVTITLDKSILATNEIRRVRVGGLDVKIDPPTPEGKISVALPRLDIAGRADVEVIGKDDKSVAIAELTYVAAAEALPAPVAKAPGARWNVLLTLLYVLLIALLPVSATWYDISKSYEERAVVLGHKLPAKPTMEEIRSLLASMDLGPTGLVGLTRGILAVTLVLVLAFVAIHLVVFEPVKVPDIAEKLLMLLAGTLTAITGFYFGSKAATEGAQKTDRSSGPASSAEKPTLSGVDQDSGTPGQRVVLTGQGFGDEPGKVTFGGTEAKPKGPQDWSDTKICVDVPPGLTPGRANIVVTTKTGTPSAELAFTVKAAATAVPVSSAAKPTLSGVDPDSGTPGQRVVLTGQGFGHEPGKVTFGGTEAKLKAPQDWSDTKIWVDVPSGLTSERANIVVTTNSGAPSSELAFTVKAAAS